MKTMLNNYSCKLLLLACMTGTKQLQSQVSLCNPWECLQSQSWSVDRLSRRQTMQNTCIQCMLQVRECRSVSTLLQSQVSLCNLTGCFRLQSWSVDYLSRRQTMQNTYNLCTPRVEVLGKNHYPGLFLN